MSQAVNPRIFLFAIALAFGASGTVMADDIPYDNPGTIAPPAVFEATQSGDVVAYFYGSSALFTNRVGLFDNGVQVGQWALQDHTSSFGDSYDFGHVQAGDTLVLALEVRDTHYKLYSDPSMNPDGINHVYTTAFSGETRGRISIPAGTFVGFEDSLLSFSDLNYNDEDFVFENVADPTAPEPGSLLLMISGALVLGLVQAKRTR